MLAWAETYLSRIRQLPNRDACCWMHGQIRMKISRFGIFAGSVDHYLISRSIFCARSLVHIEISVLRKNAEIFSPQIKQEIKLRAFRPLQMHKNFLPELLVCQFAKLFNETLSIVLALGFFPFNALLSRTTFDVAIIIIEILAKERQSQMRKTAPQIEISGKIRNSNCRQVCHCSFHSVALLFLDAFRSETDVQFFSIFFLLGWCYYELIDVR